MKLGVLIGYSGAQMQVPVELVQRAEALGYDSVWTAEAYGSDAMTPLAYLAAVTSRIKLGTGIMQTGGAHAGECGDVGRHGRRDGRRQPLHRRARRVRAADRRGLVRPALGQALLPDERLRRDHAQDLRSARSRSSMRAGRSRCRTTARAPWASASR